MLRSTFLPGVFHILNKLHEANRGNNIHAFFSQSIKASGCYTSQLCLHLDVVSEQIRIVSN